MDIGVDGYSYHNMNERQLERDQKKDNILAKYSIPIIRLNTTSSNEKKKIESI